MKQSIIMRQHGGSSSSSKWYTKEEKEVSKILLELQHSEEPPLLNWGCKRKRSAIQDSSSSSPTLVFLHNLSRHTQTLKKNKKKKASSPDTPLSFPPTTQSHPSPKIKPSLKKKKLKEEFCIGSIEDLTKRNASIDKELSNVKLFHAKALAFNLKLKAKKQELINFQKGGCSKNPSLEFGRSMCSVNPSSNSKAQKQNAKQSQRQPQTQMGMQNPHIPLGIPIPNQISGPTQSERFIVSGHPTTSLLQQVPPSSSSNGLGQQQAQLPIPDLNISPKEFSQMNSSQPLDVATANRDLNRAMAAEARRRRILIFRLGKHGSQPKTSL